MLAHVACTHVLNNMCIALRHNMLYTYTHALHALHARANTHIHTNINAIHALQTQTRPNARINKLHACLTDMQTLHARTHDLTSHYITSQQNTLRLHCMHTCNT